MICHPVRAGPIPTPMNPPFLNLMPARNPATLPRSRPVYAALVAGVIVVGLASRKFAWLLPPLLHKNAGDILWATMVFLACGLLFPRLSTGRIAFFASVFSLGIELAKFCHAPWLETVRATTLGRLVFGYTFSWSNLLCYLVGIGIGVGLELCKGGIIRREAVQRVEKHQEPR